MVDVVIDHVPKGLPPEHCNQWRRTDSEVNLLAEGYILWKAKEK